MIEMVFVIVILGILAAVAIPRLAASRDDAIIVKGKSQVSAIRSGIALQKSKNLLQGSIQTCGGVTGYYPCILSPDSNTTLFYLGEGNSSNVLEYPIYPQTNHDGSWVRSNTNQYTFQVMGTGNIFDYNTTSGSFNCTSGTNCTDLTQ